MSFTGSVQGGKLLNEAVAKGEGFKGVGLELGGKDPAYVREDVDVKWAAAELVDGESPSLHSPMPNTKLMVHARPILPGAMFNSGQSCCGIERIYVHASIYDPFILEFSRIASSYVLGNPLEKSTNLGPVVSLASAERIRKQVDDAVERGARNLVDESAFGEARRGTTLVAPAVLVDVDHNMDVMMEEVSRHF